MQSRNHSAGTAAIAKDTGGDTFPVSDASALEETLMRLRQRYALYFNSADAHSSVLVDLTDAARRRYSDAEIRYRRVSITGTSREAGPVSITHAHAPDGPGAAPTPAAAASRTSGDEDAPAPRRRRVAVDPSYGSGVNVQPRESGDKQ